MGERARRDSDWAFVPTMFVRPRLTMAAIVSGERYRWVVALAALAGVVDTLAQASGRGFSMMTVVLVTVVGGPLIGIVTLYAVGWMVAVSGRWLGGTASSEQLRAAFAWGRVPLVAVGGIYALKGCLLGDQAFTGVIGLHVGPRVMWTIIGLDPLAGVLAIWSLVTMVAAIGAVQRFSAARVVESLLLAGLVMTAGVLLLVIAIADLRP